MTIDGTVGDAKLTREYIEPQLRAAAERNVSASIDLAFADGLALDGVGETGQSPGALPRALRCSIGGRIGLPQWHEGRVTRRHDPLWKGS